MAIDRISKLHNQSVMGAYYCYFKACFFAGLFRRGVKPSLSGS